MRVVSSCSRDTPDITEIGWSNLIICLIILHHKSVNVANWLHIYREREKYSKCVRLYVDVTKEKKKQVKRKLGKIDFTRDQVTA